MSSLDLRIPMGLAAVLCAVPAAFGQAPPPTGAGADDLRFRFDGGLLVGVPHATGDMAGYRSSPGLAAAIGYDATPYVGFHLGARFLHVALDEARVGPDTSSRYVDFSIGLRGTVPLGARVRLYAEGSLLRATETEETGRGADRTSTRFAGMGAAVRAGALVYFTRIIGAGVDVGYSLARVRHDRFAEADLVNDRGWLTFDGHLSVRF